MLPEVGVRLTLKPETAPVILMAPVAVVVVRLKELPAALEEVPEARVMVPVELSVTVVMPVEVAERVWLAPVPIVLAILMPPVPALTVSDGVVRTAAALAVTEPAALLALRVSEVLAV